MLEVTIKTGRTHQIRVHLASEGMPIAGDDKYGDFDLNKALAKPDQAVPLKRMFLHAWRFQCRHPTTGKKVELHASCLTTCPSFWCTPCRPTWRKACCRFLNLLLYPMPSIRLRSTARQFDLIAFDWDGTLFDSTAIITRCIQLAVGDVGGTVPTREAAAYVIGLGLMQALAHAAPDVPPAKYAELGARYKHHYALHQNDISLFEGVLPLLAAAERATAHPDRGHRQKPPWAGRCLAGRGAAGRV